jgi:hypothetical protein
MSALPSPTEHSFLADLRSVGAFLLAVATVGATVYTVARGVRRTLRAVIRWACADDLRLREAQLRDLGAQLQRMEHQAEQAEERSVAALERVAEKLERVADNVEHITHTLVERALRT